MGMIQRLEDAAVYGPVPCPAAQEAAALLQEIRAYLVATADGSMSRNNSEQLASELLQQIDAQRSS
jgi:hypothetical protein